MESVIDRMYRWARALPVTDPIPVGVTEKRPLADALIEMNLVEFPRWQKPKTGDQAYTRLLNSLDAGLLTFMDHKVVVLK